MIEKKYNLEKWRNRLVIFEGQDKTGKSSVAQALTDYLNKNGIKIGNNSLIGIGSVVINDIKENNVVIGNPARFLKNIK